MEYLSMLCSNDLLKDLFLSNMFITTCKRNKDFEETLGPWKYPNHKNLSPLTGWSKYINYIYIYYIYIYIYIYIYLYGYRTKEQ